MLKQYKVVKYFDTYSDGVAMVTADKDKADEECNRLNNKVKHLPHTEYIVRHSNKYK